jgi:uncharacterized protein (TIGR01244 family)
MSILKSTLLVCVLCGPVAATAATDPETLPGARNYTRVDATVACGGATTAEAWPELRARGFKAVINLREASEPGADVEGGRRGAEAAGLKYVHIPMSGSNPDASTVDAFLAAVKDPANSPVYIHCGSANRVGAMWLVKRMLVDGWDQARALREAETIGLRSPALRDFMLAYVREHQRP